MNQQKVAEWVLRIGIIGTFIGHGVLALGINQSWIPFFMAVGFSKDAAITLMPMIGVLDIIVAVFVLIRPIRVVLAWAVVWAFTTALIRPIAGSPIWDFIERSANWAAPLALLYLQGLPKSAKDIFTVR